METFYVCTRFIEPVVVGGGGEDKPAKIGRKCGFRHADIFSTQGLIRVGFGGETDPSTPPPLDDPDWNSTELSREDYYQRPWIDNLIFGRIPRTLKWGTGAGKSCANATDAEIKSCLQSKPTPRGGDPLQNNCQTDCEGAASGCCLSGYVGSRFPPRIVPLTF